MERRKETFAILVFVFANTLLPLFEVLFIGKNLSYFLGSPAFNLQQFLSYVFLLCGMNTKLLSLFCSLEKPISMFVHFRISSPSISFWHENFADYRIFILSISFSHILIWMYICMHACLYLETESFCATWVGLELWVSSLCSPSLGNTGMHYHTQQQTFPWSILILSPHFAGSSIVLTGVPW